MASHLIDQDTYDVIGCGFGPSNLAIAAALVDKWSCCKVLGSQTLPASVAAANHDRQSPDTRCISNAVFIEKHPKFLWHPGMLLPGARMQVSFLKDLATLRQPTSLLTFLSYLHSQNRLVAFINRGSTIPTRREFADYLEWASLEVQKAGVQVTYSEEVVGIREEGSGFFEVVSQKTISKAVVTRRAKHIIFSAGGNPRIPRPLSSLLSEPSNSALPRVIHTSSYASSIGPLLDGLRSHQRPLRIGIIGSGQSAAEALLDLHSRLSYFPVTTAQERHLLDMIISKGSLKPSDDSPFVNEIFNPQSTDAMYDLPSCRAREAVRAEYKNTNYGVVNPRTLDSLYEVMYEQNLDDGIAARKAEKLKSTHPRIAISRYQFVIAASPADVKKGVTLTLQHTLTHELTCKTYDALICGTGYERDSWLRLLTSSNLAKRFGLAQNIDGGETSITLVPDHDLNDLQQCHFNFPHTSNLDSTFTSPGSEAQSRSCSFPSTPPTSPSLFDAAPLVTRLRISRHYRLIPCLEDGSVNKLQGSIYLQGYAEATHGLSDTLLSVLGVRAGEVVEDLWKS